MLLIYDRTLYIASNKKQIELDFLPLCIEKRTIKTKISIVYKEQVYYNVIGI